jgi:hypothetical protein
MKRYQNIRHQITVKTVGTNMEKLTNAFLGIFM